MNEKIAKEKACTSCKYYVEHYVIISTKLHAIGGHCINDNLYDPRKNNPPALRENCGDWECNASLKVERREKIEKVLCGIETHLSHIKSILEIDKQ